MNDQRRQRVLVVAAHPDDEVIGCGGTLARHVDDGNEVTVLILADGETSRGAKYDTVQYKDEIEQREEAARKACRILGVSSIEFLRFPDNRLDGLELIELIKPIEKVVENYKPTIVYTHHFGDLNVDHRRSFEAVITSCRPIPNQNIKNIFSFEIPSSTDWMATSRMSFEPNWFQDISLTVDRKIEAIEAYESEIPPWPHVRSKKAIDHLARWRGSFVGVNAAEAFQLIRAVAK